MARNQPDVEMENFEEEKIKGYPQSNKKIHLSILEFNVRNLSSARVPMKAYSIHISPYGMEFQLSADFCEEDLLKIDVIIPGYWQRKRHFIDYTRVNIPKSFSVIGRVIKKKIVGEKRKKKYFSVQILSMDNTDEKVLRSYLEESAA
ncbi:MAG: hypothetical protein OXC44_00025 [Proteobacteria bacterium]|nr:hypothetical protein [Pseudomonadota bacterium]